MIRAHALASSGNRQLQNKVELAAAAQNLYICAQVVIVPLLILHWFALASRTAHLDAMLCTLRAVASPLATLAALLLLVAVLVGMGIHVLVGDRMAVWSAWGPMSEYLAEQAFVGAQLSRA